MPEYRFDCDCTATVNVWGSMKNPPQPGICPVCGEMMYRIFGNRIETFRPFVDIHATGKPRLIESAKQRDEYYGKHGLTLDRRDYIVKKPLPSVVESVTHEDVQRQYKEHGPALDERVQLEDPSSGIGKGSTADVNPAE